MSPILRSAEVAVASRLYSAWIRRTLARSSRMPIAGVSSIQIGKLERNEAASVSLRQSSGWR
jgi:hypothetical protein